MYLAIMFFDAMAAHRPADVLPYENDVIKAFVENENMVSQGGGVLIKIASDEVRFVKLAYYI